MKIQNYTCQTLHLFNVLFMIALQMDKQRQIYSAGFNDIAAESEPPDDIYIVITGNYCLSYL